MKVFTEVDNEGKGGRERKQIMMEENRTVRDMQLKGIAEDHPRVRGKNEKVRDVWLPAEVRKAVSDYLDIRLPTDRNYVFTSRKGRMSYEYLRQRMARVAARAGVRFHNHMTSTPMRRNCSDRVFPYTLYQKYSAIRTWRRHRFTPTSTRARSSTKSRAR